MSIWQTQYWQEMLVHSGQTEEFFELDGVLIEKRKVSLWEYGLFIVGLESQDVGVKFEKRLVKLCKKEKCLFIQVETLDYSLYPSDISLNEGDPIASPSPRGTEWLTETRGSEIGGFKNWHYKKFIPPYTVVVDLTQTEEEILAAMKQKGRYNIRLAEKKWVVVEQVEKNAYNAKIYYELMNLTTSRNNFAWNTQKYYEDFLENIEDSQLFFAYYEEQVIAAGIFVYEGDTAIYYYGASNNEYRKVMAPHLLQWKAIEHAKKRGCKIYDFLGVAWPDEENSSLAGVTKFKMQLSPDRRKVSEGYIFVNKKFKYSLIQILKKIRK